MDKRSEKPLYEVLADEITRQMRSGALRPGDRLPSVRRTARLRSLSVTTALHAYRLLEERGLIAARPQSGYYVRLIVKRTPAARPPSGGAEVEPQTVQVQDVARRMRLDFSLPGLVQFGAALPAADLLPEARLNAALARQTRRSGGDLHRMAEAGGCQELRALIARRTLEAGYGAEAQDVLITNGCTEALHLALRAVCSPGDLVAVESPTYFGFFQLLESLGLRALEIPCRAGEGLDLEVLETALARHPVRALLLVTSFSNPLGVSLPPARKRRLADLLAEREIPLIEDDIYAELGYGEGRPPAAKAFDRDGNVLLCSSFSKTLSPGLRLGWILPGRRMARVEELKAAVNGFTPLWVQRAVAAYLDGGAYDAAMRRMRREYALRTARMADAVLRHFPAQTRVSAPEGGYVIWVEMPEAVDSVALYRAALGEGITISPGSLFSQDMRYRNCVRLNAAAYTPETAWAVERLGKFVCGLM